MTLHSLHEILARAISLATKMDPFCGIDFWLIFSVFFRCNILLSIVWLVTQYSMD
jgi:hypothetical protein